MILGAGTRDVQAAFSDCLDFSEPVGSIIKRRGVQQIFSAWRHDLQNKAFLNLGHQHIRTDWRGWTTTQPNGKKQVSQPELQVRLMTVKPSLLAL